MQQTCEHFPRSVPAEDLGFPNLREISFAPPSPSSHSAVGIEPLLPACFEAICHCCYEQLLVVKRMESPMTLLLTKKYFALLGPVSSAEVVAAAAAAAAADVTTVVHTAG